MMVTRCCPQWRYVKPMARIRKKKNDRSNRLFGIAWLFLAFLSPASQACDHVGVYRVNLSQDLTDIANPDICTSRIIHSLIRHPGHVRTRQQLMDDANVLGDDQTITSHIKRIRRKFVKVDAAFDRLDTVYGAGYRWKPVKDDAAAG